ncbi:hypothetical protein ACP70R_029076 [Stipagrostis hirtigluma subsp. patula]
MSVLVPHGWTRSRPRPRRGISATTPDTEGCVSVAKSWPSSNMTGTKRKRSVSNTITRPPPSRPTPELPDEIVLDILLRLPVKSLLRFNSVCKAWHAIISGPGFMEAHLQRSASEWEQDPCFIVTPVTLYRAIPGDSWPLTDCDIRFYQWQQSASNQARFVHGEDFVRLFNRLYPFAYCDGLVLVPADTRIFLFNPATRDAITLPASSRNQLPQAPRICRCTGLGLDPRTGKYKVVQGFYQPDPAANRYHMGMEVFTVNGGDGGTWKETRLDLPYPIGPYDTAVTVNGFLFWRIDKAHHRQKTLRGLLRLGLADEWFDVTMLPDSMDPALDDAFTLGVLQGELCLTACTSESVVTIWTMPIDDEGEGQWDRRYSFHFGHGLCYPMALLPGSRLLLWSPFVLYSYDLATSELTVLCEMDRIKYQRRSARKWKKLWKFNLWPYMQSLVRITV